MINRLYFSFFLCLILSISINAGYNDLIKSPVISGYIRDARSGENLISANVYVSELNLGTVSNYYGFYSLSLPQGRHTVSFSFIGYETIEIKIQIGGDTILNVELEENIQALEELVIKSPLSNNITTLETGTNKLNTQTIGKVPALLGEADVIKALQLLPGVQNTAEGSSGFSVRGGSADQNLIILDEATVYNASHLIGFFSVFNNDAIKDVKLFKGDIPASIGGRLSSLLDVRMKDGNSKKFSGSGGLGVLASRLTLEGPVVKDKSSFIISVRRTYADLFLPLIPDKDIRDNKLYFYDLNAKLNYRFSKKDKIFISGYFGRDIFKNEFAGMDLGNNTMTIRWNHLISGKFFSNFSLIHSLYNYALSTPDNRPNSFRWTSNLKDYSIKGDFIYYYSPDHTIKFGIISTYHHFLPGTAQGTGSETIFSKLVLPDNLALEHGTYIMTESYINKKLGFKVGVRLSAFQNIGEATIYTFDRSYEILDTVFYRKNQFFHSSLGFEPRAGITYSFNDVTSVKASYSRTRQYIHLAQNSTAGTPLDIWFPSGLNIKPQVSDQISVGFFRNFKSNSIETSAEVYYKKMNNTIDFKDHAILLLNPLLEGEVRTGKSHAYGLELMFQLHMTRLNGWIAYTYSRSIRKIVGVNNGNPYPAAFDKPHNVSCVLNYKLKKRISLGTNWIFTSGNPITLPTGRYEILGNIIPSYSERNGCRLPAYHRLDVSLVMSGKKKPGKKWLGEWNLSFYNAYARKNAWALNFVQDKDDPSIVHAEKTYLFSIVPSLTYNFKF